MIHPACKERGHNWDRWRFYPASEGAQGSVLKWKIEHDLMSPPEDAVVSGATYRYRRDCQTSGCDVVEYAEKLEPAGHHRLLERVFGRDS